MRNDPDSTKPIETHSIVQVIASNDNRGFDGLLAEVISKETWGVIAAIRTIGVGSSLAIHRFPWSMIEPTGGKAVFDTEGRRVADMAPKQKHHP